VRWIGHEIYKVVLLLLHLVPHYMSAGVAN